MNVGDLSNRVNLRLNDDQYGFLEEMSKMTGLTPSEYLRMMINSTMVSYRRMNEAISESQKVFKDENIKTD